MENHYQVSLVATKFWFWHKKQNEFLKTAKHLRAQEKQTTYYQQLDTKLAKIGLFLGGVAIKQEPGVKQFGRHGDIKRMMKILSKRRVEDHVDLELVCQDGKLAAHKFIIGAQSQFLK